MGRRILWSKICHSRSIEHLSLMAQNAFFRLIVTCENNGCTLALPEVLVGTMYPLCPSMTVERMEACLAEMEREGMIERYTVLGEPYLHLCNWDKYQDLRFKNSKIPGPERADGKREACSEKHSESPIYNYNNIYIYEEEIEGEAEGEAEAEVEEKKKKKEEDGARSSHTPRSPRRGDHPPMGDVGACERKGRELFERFWSVYPRRERIESARAQFLSMNVDEALLERMLDALSRMKESAAWEREGGRYIPFAVNWLRERRWQDEVPTERREEREREKREPERDAEGRCANPDDDAYWEEFMAENIEHTRRFLLQNTY